MLVQPILVLKICQQQQIWCNKYANIIWCCITNLSIMTHLMLKICYHRVIGCYKYISSNWFGVKIYDSSNLFTLADMLALILFVVQEWNFLVDFCFVVPNWNIFFVQGLGVTFFMIYTLLIGVSKHFSGTRHSLKFWILD